MRFYDLMVTVVRDVTAPDDLSLRGYSLLAQGEGETWRSPFYDEAQYRRAMSATSLNLQQIEAPIRTGDQTTFSMSGIGDYMVNEETLTCMGLKKL